MSSTERSTASRVWHAVQWGLLLSVFSYYFAENFVLSSGWEVLPLRSIDDYAMHDSVRRMQAALLSGQTRKVLTFFDYGYGNIFWLANAILFLPFHFFENAQLQILLGRQITLAFVLGTTLLVGQIAIRLRPQAEALKWPIMVTLACAPMVAIIGTKLHVNASCAFFGVWAYHTLVRDDVLRARRIHQAALLSGLAVGLKLTAVFILPLLFATLWTRLMTQGEPGARKLLTGFLWRFAVVAAGCTVPALLLFPFFLNELGATYATFQMYKNMGSDFGGAVGPLDSLADVLSYTMHPAAAAITACLFVLLARDDLRHKRWDATVLALGILTSFAFVVMTVKKAPIYMATYALSIAPLMPLGLLGLTRLRTSSMVQGLLAWAIVITGGLLLSDFRQNALSYHRFFEIAKSERVTTQLQALEGMRKAIGDLRPPLRVYLDYNSVFPATPFTKGVEVIYFYGNLRDHSEASLGRFDYVVLNPGEYLFKMTPGSAQYLAASPSERDKADREEAARKRFRDTLTLGQDRYEPIYKGQQSVLYRRIQTGAPRPSP